MKAKHIIPLLILSLVGGLHAERTDKPDRPERPERLDRPERPERPERPTPPTAEEVLEKFDADGSGALEVDEIEVMLETVRERRQANREKIRERIQERREEMRERREQMRQNRSGIPGDGPVRGNGPSGSGNDR